MPSQNPTPATKSNSQAQIYIYIFDPRAQTTSSMLVTPSLASIVLTTESNFRTETYINHEICIPFNPTINTR